MALNICPSLWNTNTWYHYTVVRNSSIGTAYLDGISKATDTSFSANLTNTHNYIIGGAEDGTQRLFNGTIDNVRVWNKALSQEEIQAEMNSPYPVKGDGLVADYEFETHNTTHTYDTNNYVQGHSGSAVTFDGIDDYVEVSPFNFLECKTISAWI